MRTQQKVPPLNDENCLTRSKTTPKIWFWGPTKQILKLICTNITALKMEKPHTGSLAK